MLQLRVFGEQPTMDALVLRLSTVEGTGHITRSADGNGGQHVVVTADVDARAADTALEAVSSLGVPPADVALLRLDAIQPGQRRRSDVVWADLLGLAGQYAALEARFLVFMAVAGVIAGYGVIFANGILIVGAMAVSPDLLPIAATCVGIVVGRRHLVRRALGTLVAGLGLAGVVAAVLTAVLDLANVVPTGFDADPGVLTGLTTVNSATVVVALAAGVAAMLALETRASSAVGVAISVTTIPASAYMGVASALGESGKAYGALAVLAINVVCLITGGTLTLVAQRALDRRHERQDATGAR